MTFPKHTVRCLFILVIVSGCASTQVSNRQVLVNEKLQRPNLILVYDFIANPAEMPADSALASQISQPSAPLTENSSRPAISWALKLPASWRRGYRIWGCRRGPCRG